MTGYRCLVLLLLWLFSVCWSLAGQGGLFPVKNEPALDNLYLAEKITKCQDNQGGCPWFFFQKISLKSASAEQLCLIKGVGEHTAQKIIDYRRQNGGFSGWSDLQKIHGIGAKTIKHLSTQACLEQHCD
ncbi:MAG: hypothetical protein CSB24_00925 [Deltaproteobacteria bacterium]|nr:MAG: hypothetical protein CSB24_00925 [Deltaproteobacteria bacterium]